MIQPSTAPLRASTLPNGSPMCRRIVRGGLVANEVEAVGTIGLLGYALRVSLIDESIADASVYCGFSNSETALARQ